MTYTPRLPAWGHQLEYGRRLAARPAGRVADDVFALLCEMGTGKTKMILDEWGARVDAKELDSLLVVAPAGTYRNWVLDKTSEELSEINKHIDPVLREQMIVAPWISRGTIGLKREIDRMIRAKTRPRMFVVNVEALSSVAAARTACREFLESGRAMMVVDESTRIKSNTNRTEAVLTLGENAPVRRIMSGLVAPRDPLDLYHQYQFLDWRILGQRSFWNYKARYAVTQQMTFNGRKQHIVVGFKNQEELQERIAPWSYRVLLEDCLDMPGETFSTHEVVLSGEQRKAIRELLEQSTTQLSSGAHVTTTMKLATLTRIDQILLGWVVDEEGNEHNVPTARYNELLDVVQDHAGKVIIWTSFQNSVERAAEALRRQYGEASVALFYGPNRSTRHVDEARFLSDPECRFMVSTPAAGGVGNTWNVATLRVYLNNSHDLEHRLQSEKRNYRGGQTKPVTSVDLFSPEVPVEMKKIAGLRKKMDVAALITDEDPRQWLI